MRFRVLLCIALLSSAISVVFEAKLASNVDFYQYWLPARAHAISDPDLGSPYLDAEAHAAGVNAEADQIWRTVGLSEAEFRDLRRSARGGSNPNRARALVRGITQRAAPVHFDLIVDNDRFLAANLRRRSPAFTESPLLYSAFTWFPADFQDAAYLYDWLQALSFLAAVLMLWRAGGGTWAGGGVVAGILALTFVPIATDWRNGNFHCLHLLAAAIPLAIACGPLRRAGQSGGAVRWAALTFATLLVYIALRPTFLLLGLALALHVVSSVGRAAALRAAVLALPIGIALWLVPCLQFGSFGVWVDWFGVLGREFAELDYARHGANISTPLILAHWTGGATWLFVVAGVAVAAAAVAAILALAPGASWIHRLRAGAGAALSNPLTAANLGVMVTLMCSPVVWGSSAAITLLAVAAMARAPAQRALGLSFWLVALGILFYSQSYEPVLRLCGVTSAIDRVQAIRMLASAAWIPLAAGMLLDLARIVRSGGERS